MTIRIYQGLYIFDVYSFLKNVTSSTLQVPLEIRFEIYFKSVFLSELKQQCQALQDSFFKTPKALLPREDRWSSTQKAFPMAPWPYHGTN